MGINPVGERLRPVCMRKNETRCAEHGDKDLHLMDFAGQPQAQHPARYAAYLRPSFPSFPLSSLLFCKGSRDLFPEWFH